MASFLSNYTIDGLLNLLFRGTVAAPYTGATAIVTLYAEAFTVAPAADGTGGTVVTGTSYARMAVTCNTTNWNAPNTSSGKRRTSNAVAQAFAAAGGTWTGPIVGIGWYDASSGGNLIAYEDLSAGVTITNGITLNFPIGNLIEQLNNA